MTLREKVSVIMPVYNGGAFLREAIESIQDQTYPDLELIVIDDRSTDGSLDLAVSIAAGDDRVRVLRHERNLGVVDALNTGLREATGTFAAFLGQDDASLPDRLREQVDFMNRHPSVVLLGSQMLSMDANGIVGPPIRFPECHEQIWFGFGLQNQVGASSMLYRRAVANLDDLRFDVRFTYAEDYDLCRRLLRKGDVRNLPISLVKYRRHEGQLSLVKGSEQKAAADVISAHERETWGERAPMSSRDRVRLNRLYRRYLRWYARVAASEAIRPSLVGPDQVPVITAYTATLQQLVRQFIRHTGAADPALAALADYATSRLVQSIVHVV